MALNKQSTQKKKALARPRLTLKQPSERGMQKTSDNQYISALK